MFFGWGNPVSDMGYRSGNNFGRLCNCPVQRYHFIDWYEKFIYSLLSKHNICYIVSLSQLLSVQT